MLVLSVMGCSNEVEQGAPQGGPLSPLLSNIMLNELDKELNGADINLSAMQMIRMILCKSRRSAESRP